jgi:hypothetical protein
MKALHLSAGLPVVRGGVLLLHPEAGQFCFEGVAARFPAAAAGEPGGEHHAV